MKKIFVPALLLGVIVPNAVYGAVNPPVSGEENAYVDTTATDLYMSSFLFLHFCDDALGVLGLYFSAFILSRVSSGGFLPGLALAQLDSLGF